MRQAIAVRPLPEWTINGVTYKAPEPRYTCSPGELDKHLTFVVGEWSLLPENDWQKSYQRLKAQSQPDYCPTIQRFEFEIRQIPDPSDEIDEALKDVPIRLLDGTVHENPWKAAEKQVETLKAEVAQLKAEREQFGKAIEPEAEKLIAENERLGDLLESRTAEANAARAEADKANAAMLDLGRENEQLKATIAEAAKASAPAGKKTK